MTIYKFGDCEVRFFNKNDSVYVIYNGYKLFIKSVDIADFMLALEKAKEELS